MPAALAHTRALPRVHPANALQALVRLVVVATAVLFVALGVTVLTSPWAIPVTVTFWLAAAALGSVGLYAPLPAH